MKNIKLNNFFANQELEDEIESNLACLQGTMINEEMKYRIRSIVDPILHKYMLRNGFNGVPKVIVSECSNGEVHVGFQSPEIVLHGMPNKRSIIKDFLRDVVPQLFQNDDYDKYLQKFPKGVIDILNKKITKNGDGCNDNLRIAQVHSPEDMVYYLSRKANGCCGFFDEIITFKDKQYLIGFNYGH